MTIRHVPLTGLVLLGCMNVSPLPASAQPAHAGLSDTLVVEQRSVTFYTPTQRQRDAYAKSRLAVLDSLSRKFARTQRGIVPFLRKVGIASVSTTRMTIRFGHGDSSVVVERRPKDLFGVVFFTPGKVPEVMRGVPADVDVLKRIFPYFDIR